MKTIKRNNLRRNNIARRRKLFIVGGLCLVLLIAFLFSFVVFSVKREATLEYGEKLDPEIFRKFPLGSITLYEDYDNLLPGQHEIVVLTGPFRHKCLVNVSDSTAPNVILNEISIGYGKELSPEDFVLEVDDISDYSISFAKNPDWKLIGSMQKISISVKDEWGNETVGETNLLINNYPQIIELELGSTIEELDGIITKFFGEVSHPTWDADLISKVCEFPITLTGNDEKYDIEIKVEDTIAPEFSVIDLVAPVGIKTEPRAFVSDVFDLSSVDITYENTPDFNKEGSYDVALKATDSSGNSTIKKAKLTLIVDTEPPTFVEAKDFDSFIGENIIFREMVEVTDNCTEAPKLKIEANNVNINAKGQYTVTYIATDLAGNESKVTIKVNIRDKEEEKKELNQKIKTIVSQIITDDMTKTQKADAIYNYVYHHITYVSRPKQDYVKAALEAINGRGGCFNYASLAMFLFDEVGIKNMFMETNVHYWNIIDVDDGHGWYHFDATPSPEAPKIFLWTDAQMMDYSSRQNRTHHYDRNKYPVIP